MFNRFRYMFCDLRILALPLFTLVLRTNNSDPKMRWLINHELFWSCGTMGHWAFGSTLSEAIDNFKEAVQHRNADRC